MTTSTKNEGLLTPRFSVNYIFFALYFLCTALLHIYHLLLVGQLFSFSQGFFLVYILFQSALETTLLILLAQLTKNIFGPKGVYFFIFLPFILLVGHTIDLPLARFLDMSFWGTVHKLMRERVQNFLEMMYATNIPIAVWISCALIGVWTLISTILFYRHSEKWCGHLPCRFSYKNVFIIIATLCVFGILWDSTLRQFVPRTEFDEYRKTLPWKKTFLPQHREFFALANPLKNMSKGEIASSEIILPTPVAHPDIFLFIIESLREDFINETNAPTLTTFKKNNISFELALSNGNATQISWFSLFHSRLPLYWGAIDSHTRIKGSVPLQLLKQIDYKINVYSSARLGYYQMGELIFGENLHLADKLISFEDVEAWERDQKAIQHLLSDISNEDETGGRLFIVFLDSTHFGYSWPHTENAPFQPYDKGINYLNATLTRGTLEGIQNRYRNSVHYVDTLFDEFLQKASSYQGGKEAVIVVTGDHGEEFYEHGHLFHASCLSQPQIHVPLYYQFGKNSEPLLERERTMSCHMDIFPSLFHYLLGQDILSNHFQGESIFRKNRWPFTVVGRYNASLPPCEFCIHNGKEKVTASFSDKTNIFESKELKILSIKDLKDQNISHNTQNITDKFGSAFEKLFGTSK